MNNRLTVIVPTYNRLSTLRLCLQALQKQTIQDFDVVVVDDGSTHEVASALEEMRRTSQLSLQVLHQENAGPARARNLALENISTPLSFLIGDDILPEPDCLEAHLDFHSTHPAKDQVAVGWTRWDQVHQEITPFMQWYEGVQFDYVKLSSGLSPTWQHFYTSNLSFKSQLFRDNPFDERFRSAALEDIELGFRLMTTGRARLTFLKNARATHIHPTTFIQATRRMQTVGRNERLFHSLWPCAPRPGGDIKSRICTFLGSNPGLLNLLTAVTDRIARQGNPTKLHSMILRSHQERGYLGLP